MHSLALAAGALIVAAVAHVSVMAADGYQAAGYHVATLQFALALGLIVGAICVGRAWRDKRYAIACCLIVALAAGELFAVIMSAERTIAARELAAAPVRDAEVARAVAQARMTSAETAKAAADSAALTEAAKPGCRKECRTLIEGARADALRELDTARADLSALPPVRSASPLADRLGIAGWALDLIAAALASIAANGLGAALVAFGSHGASHRESQQEASSEKQKVVVVPAKAIEAPTAHVHAARFGRDMLVPAEATTPVVNLYGAYLDWCAVREYHPLPTREIGSAMSELFKRAGLEIENIDGAPHLRGAMLKQLPGGHF